MPVTRVQKEDRLQKLIEKFGKSKSVVFADYRGIDVAGLSSLRTKLRAGNAELKVDKKTLMNLASIQNKFGELDRSIMEGPVAATFSYEDALAGIKVLFNFSKENDKLKLLGGIIDGKVVGPDIIQQYAKLPGREELLAKLLGSMNAPVSGTVGLFSNLIAGFVRVVDGYKDTLPAVSAPAPAPKAEATAPVEAPEAPTEVVEAAPEVSEAPAEASEPAADAAPASEEV